MWFSFPEDVIPFLQGLWRDHSTAAPELVSAALMQARKNLVVGPKRDSLKKKCPAVPLQLLEPDGLLIAANLQPSCPMPKGSKAKYTSKQKRKAAHIEKGYEKRGVSRKRPKRALGATVNKSDKGGKKSGSGRGKKTSKAPAKKGGRKGGRAAAAKKKKSK